MDGYALLKTVHVASAALSISLFALRGGWMVLDSRWLYWRPVRIVPHVVDTVLLASAIGLVIMLGQYPFAQPWLTAKVCALVVYIALGTVALKRGRTKGIRVVALLAALLVFVYIVSVAVTRSPYGLIA